MIARFLPALLVAALLFPAGRAMADEVKLKDGRVMEGKVLEDSPTRVRLQLRFGGEVTFRREEILSIERKDLPEDAIAKKRAALDPKDAAGLWALALEAKEQKLRKPFEALVEDVLKADPDHAAANEAKGRVQWEGKWVAVAERDRLAAEKEKAEKAAQGLVLYKGEWVTAEEKDARERGLVKHDGRWMSERDAKTLQGLVEYKGQWVKKEELESIRIRDSLVEAAGVPLTVATSERFSVATVYLQPDTNQVLADLEKTYGEFCRIFSVDPKARLFDHLMTREPRRCTVVILEKPAQYLKFIEGLMRSHEELRKVTPKELVEQWKGKTGFFTLDPDCWIVSFQFPYPKETTRHSAVHKLSHVLLQRWHNKGTKWSRFWLIEGLGEYQEINAFGSCQIYCIRNVYGEKGGDDPKAIGDSWKASAKTLAVTGGDSKFRDLAAKGLGDLSPMDLVKCWSMAHYLVSVDPAKLAQFTILLKEGVDFPEALQRVYGATPEQIDDRWRDYVRRVF